MMLDQAIHINRILSGCVTDIPKSVTAIASAFRTCERFNYPHGAHLLLVLRSGMVELYLHSPMHLHGMLLYVFFKHETILPLSFTLFPWSSIVLEMLIVAYLRKKFLPSVEPEINTFTS
jgi:hypothetical protein